MESTFSAPAAVVSNLIKPRSVLLSKEERWRSAQAALASAERRVKLAAAEFFDVDTVVPRDVPPGGAQGKLWHIEGGYEQLLQALSQSRHPGHWLALVNLDNLGWCRADELGIVGERTVAITICAQPRVKSGSADTSSAQSHSRQPLQALAAIIDGFDVVAVGNTVLNPGDRRALAARVRSRRITFFTTQPWNQISAPWRAQTHSLAVAASWKRVG